MMRGWFLLYSFFWAIPWSLNFMYRRFGTLCLHRQCKHRLWICNRQCSKTLPHKIQMPWNHLKERIQHSEHGKVWNQEGYFCYEHGKVLKPTTVQDQDLNTLIESYSIRRQTWKYSKKLVLHHLDIAILNSFIILPTCGPKLSHKLFRMTLVRDLIQTSGEASTSDHTTSKTGPSNQPTKRHDTQHNNGIWNVREFGVMCVLLKTQKKEWNWSVQTSMCVCVLAHVLRCITQNSISDN